jgi:phage major head subunit gpT-like protein
MVPKIMPAMSGFSTFFKKALATGPTKKKKKITMVIEIAGYSTTYGMVFKLPRECIVNTKLPHKKLISQKNMPHKRAIKNLYNFI